MKLATATLSFIITVNLVMWMYVQAGVEPIYSLTPAISVENILETFNTTRMVESWSSWAHGIPWAGDIVAGVMFIVNAVLAIIKVGALASAGFPLMLISLGAPWYLSAVFTALWGIIWFFFIVEMMSGRQTLDTT